MELFQAIHYICSTLSAFLGLIGGIWVACQYKRHKLLSHTAGFIIATTSVLDALYAFLHLEYNLDCYTHYGQLLSLHDYKLLRGITLFFVDWAVIPNSFFIALLSINTGFIVHHGRSILWERYRIFNVLWCAVLTILVYFVPILIESRDHLLETFKDYGCLELDCRFRVDYGTALISIGIVIALVVYVVTWYSIKTFPKLKHAHQVVLKLVQVYAVSIILTWIPSTAFSWLRPTNNDNDPYVTVIRLIRDAFSPARGYVQAVCIVSVSRTLSHCKDPFFVGMVKCLILQMPDANQPVIEECSNKETDKPQWKFTFTMEGSNFDFTNGSNSNLE